MVSRFSLSPDQIYQHQQREKARKEDPYRSSLPLSYPRIKTQEVLGQCAVCKDIFSVTLFRRRGNWNVQQTPRLSYNAATSTLIHRPDLCQGKVTLYGKKDF